MPPKKGTPKKKAPSASAQAKTPDASATRSRAVDLEPEVVAAEVAAAATASRVPQWVTFLFLAVPALHVLNAPYTKVEESFGIHVVHDVLRYGLNPSAWAKWDHRSFPGAVPRSFVPPIILAIATTPTAIMCNLFGLTQNGIDVQQLVRLTLACFWALCMVHLSATLRRYGKLTSYLFVFISIVQFHVPFYASRTLPNFMALPLVVVAISYTLRREYWRAIALLTATATVVRLELALIVVPLALNLVFVLKRISFVDALKAGMAGGFGALAIAAPIDYTFWSASPPADFTPLHTAWPELAAALYNIVDGKADNWGVMPKTYYAVALVKMLLGAVPLVLACGWAALGDAPAPSGAPRVAEAAREVVRVLGPSVAILIGALTNIGHKEWRFIVYVVPIVNILAALGAAAVWSLGAKGDNTRLFARLSVVGLLAGSAAFTLFSAYVSSMNYPGGDVWKALERLSIPEGSTIHFQSGALQTGASLFTFIHARVQRSASLPKNLPPYWVYSKDEDPLLLDPKGAHAAGLDYVVAEPAWGVDAHGLWKEVAGIRAFDGVKRGGKFGLNVAEDKKLSVLQRVD